MDLAGATLAAYKGLGIGDFSPLEGAKTCGCSVAGGHIAGAFSGNLGGCFNVLGWEYILGMSPHPLQSRGTSRY